MPMRAAHAWLAILVAVCAGSSAASCASGARGPKPGSAESSARGQGLRDAGLRSEMVGADTLANTRIGGPYGTVLAFRFRSQWTGVVRAVRFYAVLNSDGRDGYSGGTGGTLRVTLARDSGAPQHVPTRSALASASFAPPSRDAWPLVRFDKPAHVVAGHYYHVVFTNTDRHPESNYISINALLSYGSHEATPAVPDGLAVLLGSTSDGGRTPGNWTPRAESSGERYVPILDVQGASSDQHLGLGYMEVWSSNPKPIGGAAKVRQLLGPAPRKAITGAWLRVRRRDGATAPLQLRIERVAGGVLGSGSLPAGAIASGRPRWVHVRFPAPIAVNGGESIALSAAASQQGSYEAFPIRKGTEFGFSRRTVFDGGYAQFTAGGSWVGWDQWGGHDLHNGDLQFMLDLAGG
jgi:hypothetical protein